MDRQDGLMLNSSAKRWYRENADQIRMEEGGEEDDGEMKEMDGESDKHDVEIMMRLFRLSKLELTALVFQRQQAASAQCQGGGSLN
uniref:Uncharacterized protein n=1 Tax=Melanopsichium pennsylvanicum 4 TaxID=1398559 RepID=A0A077QW58_9BASI|nr:uncharacterized protein BN887_06162 [Melanopsichium pennsylvanicum 4]